MSQISMYATVDFDALLEDISSFELRITKLKTSNNILVKVKELKLSLERAKKIIDAYGDDCDDILENIEIVQNKLINSEAVVKKTAQRKSQVQRRIKGVSMIKGLETNITNSTQQLSKILLELKNCPICGSMIDDHVVDAVVSELS